MKKIWKQTSEAADEKTIGYSDKDLLCEMFSYYSFNGQNSNIKTLTYVFNF